MSPSSSRLFAVLLRATAAPLLLLVLVVMADDGRVDGDENSGAIDGDDGAGVAGAAAAAVTLIKVGGSSITDKAVKESLDLDAVNWFARVVSENSYPAYLRPDLEASCRSRGGGSADSSGAGSSSAFVVVHGAGSFGHHTAKEFGLQGKRDPPPRLHPPPSSSTPPSSGETDEERKGRKRRTMQGLAETRLSVQTLNRHVVEALVNHGVNAVGISPCFGIPSMQAHGGGGNSGSSDSGSDDFDAVRSLRRVVETTLRAGLVPVLHGDACLYGEPGGDGIGAGILSGDTLMEMLGGAPWVTRAVFLTDVDGVHAKDPKIDPSAELVREIAVNGNGEIESVDLKIPEASGSSHEHDVTGGLKTKLESALSIAASGKNVTIARCGSESAERVVRSIRSQVQQELDSSSSIDSIATNATVLFRTTRR